MAGGFVQHQDARVFQDDARQRHTLLFASAQTVTPLAHDGVITVRQADDKIVNISRTCSRLQLRLGGIQLGVHQVRADGIMEQVGLLGYHADLG